MIVRWAFLMVYGTIVTLWGGAVVFTGWWTITGHCCGSPLIGAGWDDCLPVGDDMWPTKYIMKGHCDASTWKRVYP